MKFDLAMTDELLATTRAVRRRLDLERPVAREIIEECIELAVQAPTAANSQSWRWLIVDDPDKRKALAELYRETAQSYLVTAAEQAQQAGQQQTARVYRNAHYLGEHLEQVPLHVIPCIVRPPGGFAGLTPATAAGLYGSIFPAVWSFQLALRARGLGSTLTMFHLVREDDAAKLLGIPEDVMQVALLPVAYTQGTDFKRAIRPPVKGIIHWNEW